MSSATVWWVSQPRQRTSLLSSPLVFHGRLGCPARFEINGFCGAFGGEGRPCFHDLLPLCEHGAPPVGLFGLISRYVRDAELNRLVGKVGLLITPGFERA